MRRMFVLSILIAAFASIAFAQNDTADARKAIDANSKAFIAAFNKGDAAGVAAIYDSNAKLLPDKSVMLEGRQNIQTFWADAIKAGLKMVSLTPIDVATGGDLAIETGKYVTTVPASGGGTMTDEGKYVVVWKRQGKGWMIIRDIWNSDKP